jgi:hypothetical protein
MVKRGIEREKRKHECEDDEGRNTKRRVSWK